jgi:hypothetical protein
MILRKLYIFSFLVTIINLLSSVFFSILIFKSSSQIINFYAFLLISFNLFSIFEFGYIQKYISKLDDINSFFENALPIIVTQFGLSIFVFWYKDFQLTYLLISFGLLFKTLCSFFYNKFLFNGNIKNEIVTRLLLSSGFQLIIIVFFLINKFVSINFFAFVFFISYLLILAILIYKERKLNFCVIKNLKFEIINYKYIILNFSSLLLFTIPILLNDLFSNNFIIRYTLFLQLLNIFVQFSISTKPFIYKKIDYIRLKNNNKNFFLKLFIGILLIFLSYYIMFFFMKDIIYGFLDLNIDKKDFFILGNPFVILIILFEIYSGLLVGYALRLGNKYFWATSIITLIIILFSYLILRDNFNFYILFSSLIYIFLLYIPNIIISIISITNEKKL